jgi:hypothetical protein
LLTLLQRLHLPTALLSTRLQCECCYCQCLEVGESVCVGPKEERACYTCCHGAPACYTCAQLRCV